MRQRRKASYVRAMNAKEEIEFFAKGDYFWIRKRMILSRSYKRCQPGVWPPVNIPQSFPDIIPILNSSMIKEMNANVIRTYTILPPQFYKALRQFNQIEMVKRTPCRDMR